MSASGKTYPYSVDNSLTCVTAPLQPDARQVAVFCERITALGIPQHVEIELAVKTRTAQTIVDAAQALQQLERPLLLGHNRVQEALATIPQVREVFPSANVALIGPMQSHKINQMLRVCNEVATIERVEQAQQLASRVLRQRDNAPLAETIQTPFPVWVQVNVSGEETKSGCQPDAAHAVVAACSEAGLLVRGLMTIGLNSPDLDEVAKGYRLLAQLQSEVCTDFPTVTGISMGMSHDYQLAIDCGATRVRLGTTVFGPRP